VVLLTLSQYQTFVLIAGDRESLLAAELTTRVEGVKEKALHNWGTKDPEEYKRKHYKKGGYHWETSGVHAYAVLKKYAKSLPKADVVVGITATDEICEKCRKKIYKNTGVKKINGIPYHIKCK